MFLPAFDVGESYEILRLVFNINMLYTFIRVSGTNFGIILFVQGGEDLFDESVSYFFCLNDLRSML